jgi:hypothetical protein
VCMLISNYSSSAHELVLPFLSVPAGAGPRRPPVGVAIGHTLLEPPAASPWWTNASSPAVSSPPGTLKARGNARRRSASPRHSAVGCRCAPRPGARLAGSGTTSGPDPRSPATTRNSSCLSARCRHPTHVRTGPWCSADMLDTRFRMGGGCEPPRSLARDRGWFDLGGWWGGCGLVLWGG